MNINTFFRVLYLSFFSSRFYKDVFEKWSVKQPLFIILIITILGSVITQVDLLYTILSLDTKKILTSLESKDISILNNNERLLRDIIAQVPTVHLNRGELNTDEEKIFEIKSPRSDRILFVINTKDQSINNNAIINITNKFIYLGGPSKKIPIRQLVNIQEGTITIDHTAILALISANQNYFFWLVVAIAALPMLIIKHMVEWIIPVLLYSLFGMIFAKNYIKCNFSQAFKLCAASSVPAYIITATTAPILAILLPVQALELLCFATSALYFAFAIVSNK